MRALIVYAHNEPTSFNGSMMRTATKALEMVGYDVVVSDLYAMRFDPVSDRRNFTSVADFRAGCASRPKRFMPAPMADMRPSCRPKWTSSPQATC